MSRQNKTDVICAVNLSTTHNDTIYIRYFIYLEGNTNEGEITARNKT